MTQSEKCVTITKMCQLEKWVTVKKNALQLEKWVTVGKCVRVRIMCHMSDGSDLETYVTVREMCHRKMGQA